MPTPLNKQLSLKSMFRRLWGWIVKLSPTKQDSIQRQREINLLTLIENTDDLIWSIDLDHRLILLNSRFRQVFFALYGINLRVGMNIMEYTAPHLKAKWREINEQVLLGGNVRFELQREAEGQHLDFEISATPIKSDNGQITGASFFGRDITERKRVEAALQESEARYKLLFDTAPVAIFTKDREGRYTSVNTDTLTYWPHSPIGYTDADLLPQEIADKLRAIDVQVMETGQEATLEEEFLSPNGLRILLSRKLPIRGADGQVVGLLGTSQDITERKLAEDLLQSYSQDLKAQVEQRTAELTILNAELRREIAERKQFEEELRQREAYHRTVLDNAFEGVAIFSKDRTIRYVNKAVTNILGYKPDELVGKTSNEILFPDDLEPVQESFSRMVALQERVSHNERRYRHKNGEWRIIESRRVNMLDNPIVQGIISNFRDVTEQRQAEATIRSSEAKLRAIVDYAPDAIYIKDKEGRYLFVNKARATIAGVSVEDIIGETDYFLFDPEEAQRIQEMDRQVMASGEVVSYESEGIYVSQNWQAFSTTKYPYRSQRGELLGVVGITRNITELKQIDRQLAASLAEKDILLKEIHHRVKNNLQVISSLLDLQSEYIQDQQALRAFQESQQRIKSMSLIHERLYQHGDLARVDLVEYIENLTRNLFQSYRVGNQAISLTCHIEPIYLGLDTAIPCGLIINELVTNALKYAFPTGGQSGQIEVVFKAVGNHQLCLTVRDDGVGLPSELELEQATTLGLILVTTLVKQLNGTLEIKREAGTEIMITFAESKG